MEKPSVSFVVPAFNEKGNLAGVVRGLGEQMAGHDYEVIVVDDGSADGTSELADQLAAQDPQHVRVIHHPRNLGGGTATRTGLSAAVKQLVMMIVPGDGQFAADDLPRYLAAMEGHDVVLGWRRNRTGGWKRRLNSWCYRMVIRLTLGLKFRDINWVKLYRREQLQSLNIQSTSWLIDAEILHQLVRRGCRWTEIEVRELARRSGKPSGSNPRYMLATAIELWRSCRRLKREAAADGKRAGDSSTS